MTKYTIYVGARSISGWRAWRNGESGDLLPDAVGMSCDSVRAGAERVPTVSGRHNVPVLLGDGGAAAPPRQRERSERERSGTARRSERERRERERSGGAERMEPYLRRPSKHARVTYDRGGTGTASVVGAPTLVDIFQFMDGALVDMIIKPLDPLYAEDLDSLDSSALISLLDAHPAFRALMPAPDREWLRFNQYLLPQVIQFATRPVDAQFVIAAYDMGERYRGDPHLQWLCSTRGARGVYPYTSDDASALMQDMPQLGTRAVILLGCTEEELKRTRGRCRRHAAFETSAARIHDMMESNENDTEDADSAP